MLPYLVLDPLLATLPEESAGSEIGPWFVALMAWLREIAASEADCWRHFSACTDRLIQEQRFPEFTRLRQLVIRHGLDCNLGHLSAQIQAFFRDERRDIRGQLGVRDALCEPDARIDPPEIVERNLPSVRPDLAVGLLCIACETQAGGVEHKLVTRPLGESASTAAVRVQGHVTLADPECVADRIGEDLDISIPLLLSPEDLCDLLSPAEVLEDGPSAFLQAIRLRAARFSTGATLLAAELGPFFWNSLARSAIHQDSAAMEKLLRTCSHVLLDQAADINVDLRPFRQSSAADAPQKRRSRDGARAWRLTLSKYGIGWRLNYWLVPGTPATVEFAIVQRKQDSEEIPE